MWNITFHRLVEEEDFKKIDRADQRLIVRTIEKKLTKAPETFGKPLTGPLKGFWRLRVRDYRVIYRIEKREVIVQIVKIGIRRDSEVYEEMLRRIPYLINIGPA